MRARIVRTLAVGLSILGHLWPVSAEMSTRLVIEPDPGRPRNSEGDLLELKDGRLCLVYTRFSGGTSDHARADLTMRMSADGGVTWSDDTVIVALEGGRNVMSVSLLRLEDGRIALFYLRKHSLADCRPVLRISRDEAMTWSEPTICITDEVGYYVVNNDRVVELRGGRLVIPAAQHTSGNDTWFAGRAVCYLSDDGGQSWRRSESVLTLPAKLECPTGLQEPGVVELLDGRLMMFCRTAQGSQYLSFSEDGGEVWSEPRPSSLGSPISPASIERIPWNGNLMCVWNDHGGRHDFSAGRRSPLCVAISRDDGATWLPSRVIESDPDGWYCYTSLAFVGEQAFLAYCAGDSRVGGLNRFKMASLSRKWLQKLVARDGPAAGDDALSGRILDYGRSFINTRAIFNSPRFWVESRLRVVDPASGRSSEYYQCGSCKAERTFGDKDLFVDDNYDFLPVFSETECVVFRRKSRVTGDYRDVRPVTDYWGGTIPKLRKVDGRVLTSAAAVFAAIEAGQPLVGRTEWRDERTGRIAVLEYPVKTINWHREKEIWQVDTGPVLFPDLSVGPERWSETLRLAYIAFRSSLLPSASGQFPEWADFIVEDPTVIEAENEKTPRVFHYSAKVHRKVRNQLIAQIDS